MNQLETRRLVLKGIVAVPLALSLGCSTETQPKNIPEVSTESWPTKNIPSDEIPVRVDVRESDLYAPFGLQRLYIVSSNPDALVSVTCLWDLKEVREGSGETTISKVAFKRAQRYFTPNEPMDSESRQVSTLNQSERLFLERSFNKTGQRIIGDEQKDTPFFAVVLDKPTLDEAYTLVFREGLVEYKRRPSPLSYLKTKFIFAKPKEPEQLPATSA